VLVLPLLGEGVDASALFRNAEDCRCRALEAVVREKRHGWSVVLNAEAIVEIDQLS